ncbi:unnamed protein product [Calicophoron daubneyi]|uniref:RRM domain-containing protein n=1 Tax=Calicophoron daubneyi TaxID=300641 RepID=A0AAV2TMW5_CALDB
MSRKCFTCPPGYGFIDCASEEDAEKAKNHIIECAKVTGRKLSVTFAYENEKDLLNVYVQHLPRVDFTKEKLEDMFQKYGQVTSVKLMEADNGLTGCGFVRFASAEQAKKAVEQMNEAKLILGNNDKPVACKLADKADTRRRTLAATQAAAAAMLQPQQTLGNQLHRQNLPVCNSASPQAVSMPQTQTQPLSPYGQGVPVAPQSLPPLQQSHVAVPSMTSLASPHSRGVLAPSVLPNGSCPSAVGPMSFSSLVLGALNPHGSNISHRATPLIGPPPHPQVPAGLQPQQNPNLVAAYAAAMDANQGRAKTATGVQSTGYPNVTAGSVYLPNGGSIGSPSILNSSQPLPYLNSVPSNMQYPTHYAQQQPQQTLPAVSVNPSNPHLLVLAQPSATCTYQQPVSNALSTCSMNQIAQQYALMSPTQTTSMPKSAGLQHAAVVYQQQAAFMANQECSNSNNVNLVTSEFQSMTLNMPASANRPMPPASAPQLSLCANESVSWKGCPAVEVSRSAEPQSDPISVAFQPAPGSVGPAGDVQFSVCDRDCVSASAAQTPMFEHCEQAKNLSSGHCCSNSPLDTSALARSLSSASNSDDAVTGAQAADVISTSSTRLSPHPCNTSISGDNYEQNGSTSTDQRGVEGVWTKKYNRMIRKKHESPTTSASRGRRRSESGLNDGRATLAHMNSNRRRKLVASNSSRTGESVNGNEIDLLQSTNRMTEPNPTKQLPTTCPSAPAAPQSTLP